LTHSLTLINRLEKVFHYYLSIKRSSSVTQVCVKYWHLSIMTSSSFTKRHSNIFASEVSLLGRPSLIIRPKFPAAWRQLFHATWKTFRTEFSGLLVNIQRHGRLVESQANLVEFEQLFHQMEMGRAEAKADFQRRKEEEERNRRITVRNWLSAASTDVDQERGVSARKHNPGSGRWLLDNNQVQGWFNPEFCSVPLVWINGIPGAGQFNAPSLGVTFN